MKKLTVFFCGWGQRWPKKCKPWLLTATNSLDASWASDTIERITAVAGQFKVLARNDAIRPATRNKIAKAIEENRKRMLDRAVSIPLQKENRRG